MIESSSKNRNRRGLIVPLVLAAIAVFLSVLTIVLDGGSMLVAHGELQGLAETAALAAATTGPRAEKAEDLLSHFIERNDLVDCKAKVLVEDGVVTVIIEREVPLLLSKTFSGGKVGLRGAASAIRQDGQVRLLP